MKFMFNYIISLPFFVSLVWLVIYLINYRKLHSANRFMMLWVATSTILFGCHMIYYGGVTELKPYAEPLYLLCNQSVYPLYLIYILKLTKEDFKIKRYLLLFIPALLLSVTSIFMKGSAEMVWIHKSSVMTLFVMNLMIFIIVASKSIAEYQYRVMNFYSNVTKKDLNHISRLMYAFIATAVLSFIANGLGREYFLVGHIGIMAMAVIFAILIFLVSYFSITQKFSIEDVVRDENVNSRATTTTQEPNIVIDSIKEKIETLFRSEKLYLTPELTISTLAQKLGTNRTYISRVINEEFGVSFNQYVNQLRVERAKTLMRENPDMKHYLVAEKSGFANEQSFYRNFKKIEERTPQAWLKKSE